MARPLRIEYENAWYHIMNRGKDHKAIYHHDGHRQLFLSLLAEIYERYQVEIHAYCLMSNHYHLLIKTPLGNLSKAMRHLNSLYTQRYNKSTQKDGALFRGRFKSIVVDAENYLLQLSRYIHLNPVSAGMVNHAEDYRWSSYREYLNTKTKYPWLKLEETLKYFGNTNLALKYKNFIEAGVDTEIKNFYEKPRLIPLLGSKIFTKEISEKYLNNKPIEYEIPEHKNIKKISIPTIQIIMQMTAKYYQVDMNLLTKNKRGKNNLSRCMAIYLASQLCQKNLAEIANEFGFTSYSAVSNTCRRFVLLMDKKEEIKRAADELFLTIKKLCHVKT